MAKKPNTSSTLETKPPTSNEKSNESTSSPEAEQKEDQVPTKEPDQSRATAVELPSVLQIKPSEKPRVKPSEPAKDESDHAQAAIETLTDSRPAQTDPLRDLLAEDLRDTLLEKITNSTMRGKVADQIKGDNVLDQIKFIKKWMKITPTAEAAGQLPNGQPAAKQLGFFERGFKLENVNANKQHRWE